jgi:tetratricopeptide (TPR) repeat protein
MKKYYITLSALLAFMSFYAQEQKDTSLEKQIMRQSLAYGDSDIATNSLYAIIAKEGANSTYKDSLAYLYYGARKYSSCFMVCTDILSKDGDKQDILEMQAISLESLGVLDKAVQSYAKLTIKSNNNFHAYKMANIYYGLKKYKESLMAINKAEELKDTGELNVSYSINKNHSQQVPLKAAIANLKGLIQFAMEDNTAAKVSFERAISLYGDFVFAKENLQALIDGKISEEKK